MNKKSTNQNEKMRKEVFFLEAIYDANHGTVAIFGNAQGLSHLRELVNDLIVNGSEGSHYHLEDYNGLDGNVALILGRASNPTPSEAVSGGKPDSGTDEITDLPKDIPNEVIALVNEEKPLEAMRVLIKAKGISLIEARRVVSSLYRIREAGLILTRQDSTS